MSSLARNDVAHRMIAAQDDDDTVVLPNACKGDVIELGDDTRLRCFSIITRQPHTVPPESWSVIQTPDMPKTDGVHGLVKNRIMVDHVTRGFIGDNAMQFTTGASGELESIRLLPPNSAPAQQQWEAQAAKMLQ